MAIEIPYIMSDNSITVLIGNKCHIIDISSPEFLGVRDAVRDQDWARVERTIDRAKAINTYGKGKVVVKDGNVYYNGQPLHNALTIKMLNMMNQGFNITPLVNFLDRVMLNPSSTAVEELYLFLESGHIPISPEGYILAYKAVNRDYKDYHSGKFDNSVGSEHEMRRNEVDDNRNNTCSRGFHFCSLSYSKQFLRTGGHLMIVQINPADVVSIPNDYNNTKGRTWRYKVVGEYEVVGKDYNDFTDKEVVTTYSPEYVEDDDDDEDEGIDLGDGYVYSTTIDQDSVLYDMVRYNDRFTKSDLLEDMTQEELEDLVDSGLIERRLRNATGQFVNAYYPTDLGKKYAKKKLGI